ncbi:putative P-loop containing nucleoside triphosphate hydrolase [Helianthus anomalus]
MPHDFQNMSSPYYKGLLYTEKAPGTGTCTGTGTTHESESTTTSVAAAMTHDFHNFSAPSPYYKGLLNQATSPDRESVATTTVSSGSRMSFYVKIPELGCFKFKAKDEKPPTMVKVYSTESSNDQESLRERGSEPTSPQFSPPVQPPLPPPVLSVSPTKKVAVTAKDDDAIESKDGMKYIWADRYRPLTLKDFICNKDKAIELQKTIKDDECRHFIFEGQAGVGKRTMIWALLRDVYGADKVQVIQSYDVVFLIT